MVSPLVENAVVTGLVAVILAVILVSFPWDRVELTFGQPRVRPPTLFVYALAALVAVLALTYSLLVIQQPVLGIGATVVLFAIAFGYDRSSFS